MLPHSYPKSPKQAHPRSADNDYKYRPALLLTFLISGCSTMTNENFIQPYQIQRDAATTQAIQATSGFDTDEAKTMLEMCIELNNQDDRNNPDLPDPEHQFYANPVGWDLVYDSRMPGNTQWNRQFPYTDADRAEDKPNPNDIKTNGIKPLNGAWLLAKSQTHRGVYALAVRGTVAEWQSILTDAYATTIPAFAGVEYPKNHTLPVVFASTPMAEVHLGFAYAALGLLLDDQRGVLTQIKRVLANEDISKLYITGHSQGAAVATLIQAFLYYAIQEENIPYGLETLKHTQIKSYLYAQPKPGNMQFGYDFARTSKNQAFVINNDRDPIPQVPLSLESVSEVATIVEADNADITVGSKVAQLASKITDAKNDVRGFFSEVPIDAMVKKFKDAEISESLARYFADYRAPLTDAKAKSLNYTLAGQLIPVFGLEKGGDLYPIEAIDGKVKADILLQHHATSYRKLIDQQL